jgi:D-alanine transaminase
VTRTVYVNGQYQPYAEASVHAEDRGFQFGDAVYEVCEVSGGRLVDETRHMQRLARSLSELRIPAPMAPGAWSRVMRETIRRRCHAARAHAISCSRPST